MIVECCAMARAISLLARRISTYACCVVGESQQDIFAIFCFSATAEFAFDVSGWKAHNVK